MDRLLFALYEYVAFDMYEVMNVTVPTSTAVLYTVLGMLSSLRALYVGSTSKFGLEQRHDRSSTTFQCCSNVRCPLGCSELRHGTVVWQHYGWSKCYIAT